MPTNHSYSDAELLSDLKNEVSIDRAIRYLYDNYYGLLENYVLKNSGDEEDAEDMFQEVLIVFIDMVKRDKYRQDASVKSFLYTLMRNLWISEIRKRGSAVKRETSYENERENIESDISEELAQREGQKFVMQLFDNLGAKCKEILTMFYYEELPMKEILERTEYQSDQVLRNKKYKCLKELISRIEQSPIIYRNLKSALQDGK